VLLKMNTKCIQLSKKCIHFSRSGPDAHERDASRVEAVECFEHGCVCPGPGLDDIEEVARVDEHVGFFFDNCIDCRQEVIVHLLLAEVHPALGIEPVERGEVKVGVGDVDEVHFLRSVFGFLWDIRR